MRGGRLCRGRVRIRLESPLRKITDAASADHTSPGPPPQPGRQRRLSSPGRATHAAAAATRPPPPPPTHQPTHPPTCPQTSPPRASAVPLTFPAPCSRRSAGEDAGLREDVDGPHRDARPPARGRRRGGQAGARREGRRAGRAAAPRLWRQAARGRPRARGLRRAGGAYLSLLHFGGGPGGPAGERERRGRRWPAAGGRPAGSPSGLARPGWALRPSSPPRSLAAPCARHARALVPTPGAQLTAPLRHRCPARSPCARPQESTLHLVLSLDGGAKKRKKKVYTTPKVSQPTRTVLCWPNKTGPANPTCLSLVRPTRC